MMDRNFVAIDISLVYTHIQECLVVNSSMFRKSQITIVPSGSFP